MYHWKYVKNTFKKYLDNFSTVTTQKRKIT